MSDLIREIVEEALGRTGRTETRSAGGPPGRPAGLPDTAAAPGAAVTLNRPNWQQAYREKRLQLAGAAPAAKATDGEPARTADDRTAGSAGRREFVEQTLSPLLRLMMSQGKATVDARSGEPFTDDGGQPLLCSAGMIGRPESGIRCWFYPDLNPRLAAAFGIHRAQPLTVGVLASESDSPRPLFALDEALRAEPVQADVTVRREAGALEIRLIGSKRGEIQRALERLCRALREETGDQARIMTAPEPSAALAGWLDIPARDAAAAIDGLNRHRSIALLDRAFKEKPELDIRFRIEPSHLLIHGARGAVLEAVGIMKREAGPYLTKE